MRRHPGTFRRRLAPVLALAAALAAACTYQGAIDEPVTLKATWFSYLNGDDIRAACPQGGPARYRLVYNGNYDEQLRSYELVADGSGGAHLKVRVQTGGGIDVTRLSILDPQAPARWTTSEARLGEAEFIALEAALAASGAYEGAPQGLRLASEGFYWIFVACRAGQVHFNAWRHPSARFAALRFPEILLRHDATGIPVNPPRGGVPVAPARRITPGDGASLHFDLEVGANGLKGHQTLF